jgi:hypothetical protein
MSSQARKSILDDALTCIGNRISTILLRPGDKDENYIISLHNEVVSIIQCIHIGVILNLELACCRVDVWRSVIWWQLCRSRVSQGRIPLFFGHKEPRQLYDA